MSQAISRRSFLKCAGSGAVSLAAALLTGVSAAAAELRAAGDPALLDGKAAVELLGYAPAPGLGGVLVYLSVENLSGHALPVGESYLQSRRVSTREDLYSMGTGVTAACNGRAVRCGSFAAPLYGENAADASIFTLNLAAGRGALLHCFCAVPEDWQTLELAYAPDFAAGRIELLVATTVIEVGVDVPNATLMIIEHAERFGLAQLHQLRGRVGRGGGAAACVLLFDGNLSETGKERLKIIRESNDGFEIARRDLELRGPGEFLGEQQSGMPMLQFADLDSDAELVETASRTADLMLKQYPEQAARHAARWFSAKAELLKA